MDLLITGQNTTAAVASTDGHQGQSHGQTSNDPTEDALILFNNYVSTGLLAVLSPLGIATNTLNIIVYWNEGFREKVNITFLSLSFWDLMQCVLLLLSEICIVLQITVSQPTIQPIAIQFLFLAHSRGCTYVLSTLVTVYLSIERSICILLPFKVKDIFTTPRVVLVNCIIFVFGLTCFSPAWAAQGLQWAFDHKTNRTRLVVWLSANRRSIDLFVDTFNGIVIPAMAQLLITVTGWFMIQGINKSNKFRQKETDLRKPVNLVHLNDKLPKRTYTSMSFTRGKGITNKDVKLTKVVVLLATIFFACNLPVVLVAVLRAMIPELDVNKSLYSWYKVLYAIVYCCGLISCTVHIFVYYNFSTKYRRGFVTLFTRANDVT